MCFWWDWIRNHPLRNCLPPVFHGKFIHLKIISCRNPTNSHFWNCQCKISSMSEELPTLLDCPPSYSNLRNPLLKLSAYSEYAWDEGDTNCARWPIQRSTIFLHHRERMAVCFYYHSLYGWSEWTFHVQCTLRQPTTSQPPQK